MSDKDLMKIIKGIKRECARHTASCDGCRFKRDLKPCQINSLIGHLHQDEPDKWDMEEIERIIND